MPEPGPQKSPVAPPRSSGVTAPQDGKPPAASPAVRYEEVDFWDDYDRQVEAGRIPRQETYHETLERLGRSLRSIL